MVSLHTLTTAQLRQALEYREQIESLQQKLEAIVGGPDASSGSGTKPKRKVGRSPGKRTISAEHRAKLAAAQKARWAKAKGTPIKWWQGKRVPSLLRAGPTWRQR
jgi:hypothetical protein